MEKKPLGLYIHIPFCKSKCSYCDFYSLPKSEEKMDAYVDALIAHLEEVSPRMSANTIDTIYFGGGTPSYLGSKRLAKILKCIEKKYPVDRNAEITMEANPDSIGDIKDLKVLKKAGFNRLSIGVQSTDDALLKNIGRIHTYAQVENAVKTARAAKFDNISVDLIYGLPEQNMDHWKNTLQKILELKPEHISCYGLKVEEGTALFEKIDQVHIADDDLQADMYLYMVDFLKENGYPQYEISNFAKPGYESRHNLKYWTLGEYAGFGPGAHSDFGNIRFAYEKSLDSYIRGELILSENEEISAMDRDLEYIMLSLRTIRGIDANYFERKYRQRFEPMEKLFVSYEKHGLCERTESGWRLTPKGFFVSNTLIITLQEAIGEEKQRKLREAAKGNYRIN